MKGKGHEVTARNLATGDETELSRPITTDPWDNAIMYGETEDTAGNKQGLCGGGAGDGVRRELPGERNQEREIAGGGAGSARR